MADGIDALESYEDRPPPLNEPTRLARLMGLEDSAELDDVELARRVANGLPTTVVISFARILGRSKVIGLMVPEATYRRLSKQGKPLTREHSERIYEVGRVLDALARVYHGDLKKCSDSSTAHIWCSAARRLSTWRDRVRRVPRRS